MYVGTINTGSFRFWGILEVLSGLLQGLHGFAKDVKQIIEAYRVCTFS